MSDRSSRLWVIDDEPSQRFPIYTRGNAGEVYPNVITPLSGSVVKGAIDRGQAQAFIDLGAVVPADLGESVDGVLTGCFGGYLYANLSLGRLMGARTPSMKPEDADIQMFGVSDAPPYRRQAGDRNLRATARLGRTMVATLRGPDFSWLTREREETLAWAAAQPDPREATVEALLTTVAEGAERFTPLMRSLLKASIHGGAAAAVVERLTAKADVELRTRTAVGVGGVESAQPAAELWQLARMVSASPALTAIFDADGPIGPRLDAGGEDTAEFAAAFKDFLDRHGARGPDEWELASDTWGTDPEIALAAVERIRHSTGPDPLESLRRLAAERENAIAALTRSVPAPVRGLFRRVTRTVADGSAGRELAKGTIIRNAYAMRLALNELVRRAQHNGGPAERRDCWLVTLHELPAFVERPADFETVITERRAQRDLLQSRVPPFVFEGRIPPPSTWPLRTDVPAGVEAAVTGARLEGIGVSPGVARGRARVIRDPGDPSALEPGEILVAPITDPAWTPLFLVAGAVVVEVGAQLSHAAIVARELGIPAVVSVGDATTRLPDGAMVEVDGTRGTVLLL